MADSVVKKRTAHMHTRYYTDNSLSLHSTSINQIFNNSLINLKSQKKSQYLTLLIIIIKLILPTTITNKIFLHIKYHWWSKNWQ